MKIGSAVTSQREKQSGSTQRISILAALIVMIIFFSITSPYFLQIDNFMTIALQTAITAITSYGLTFVIISGANDISIGSSIALTGVIAALMLAAGWPVWISLIITLLAGALIGILNGLMVAEMKLPPFIATLGSQMALRGLAMIISDAKPVYIQNVPNFKYLAQYRLFDLIPLPVIYMFVLCGIMAFILRKTVIGRNVFAVGSNEEAAKLSGIRVTKVRVFAYMLSGLMASVAGIIMCSRVTSGQPGIATGYEGNAIAAAVIGGCSMRGGQGSIMGSIVGAFILGVLLNGLNLLNVSLNWQTFATGLVVIVAVWIDKVRSAEKN